MMNTLRISEKYAFSKYIILTVITVTFLSCSCKQKPEENYLEPVNVSNNSGRSENPSIAVDLRGTAYLFWDDYTGGDGSDLLYYAFKPRNGLWSTSTRIFTNLRGCRFPCIKVDKNDGLHLAWQQWANDGWVIFYAYKPFGGNWSTPETINDNSNSEINPQLAVDDSDNVHLIWSYYSGIHYRMRTSQGIWGPLMTVCEQIAVYDYNIAVDNQKNIHIVWNYGGDIFYSSKTENGFFSQPENISNTTNAYGNCAVEADNQGDLHCLWNDGTLIYPKPWLYYRIKEPNGTWINKVPPCTLSGVWLDVLFAKGPQNELYIPGAVNDTNRNKYYLLYLTRPQGGMWSDTIICGTVKMEPYFFPTEAFACDNERKLYFVGTTEPDPANIANKEIFCTEYQIIR